MLRMTGPLFPGFGGPGLSYLSLSLVGDGRECTLKVMDSVIAAADGFALDQTEEGWREIFERCLKPYVEELAK